MDLLPRRPMKKINLRMMENFLNKPRKSHRPRKSLLKINPSIKSRMAAIVWKIVRSQFKLRKNLLVLKRD